MGLFDIFKKQPEANPNPNISNKFEIVDNLFMINVPKEWNQFESDRFRMKNDSGTIQFSISNYKMPPDAANTFSIANLKEMASHLFNDFVTNGGYEAYDDFDAGKNYMYKGFKVDAETQYYYYTFRKVSSQLIVSHFCIREVGGYSEDTKKLIKDIGASISVNLVKR